MKIYRIVASKWAKTLLIASGRAARWNSKNVEMLSFAQSRSLACLENIVHRNSADLQNVQFSLVIVHATNGMEEINIEDLPVGWDGIDEKAYEKCRPFGDNWVHGNSSLILKVPSVLAPGEFNYLINPKHPDIATLKIIEILPFTFDSRIKKRQS
jgi:RES domain-containing protein